MDVFIVNNTGKIFFVRLLARPSEKRGVLHEMVFEIHSQMPKKTKETVGIQAVMNGQIKKSSIQNPKSKVVLSDQADSKLDFTKEKNEKDIVIKIKTTN